MKRVNLTGGDLIEVDNLEQIIATMVKVPEERDSDGQARILAYLKTGELIEISEIEFESLKTAGVQVGAMDDIVTVTFYETEHEFGYYIKEDTEEAPEDWLDSLQSECWTLRRCNLTLAMERYVDYRKLMGSMQESALDLREGRVTQEEIDEQVRQVHEMKGKGFKSFIEGIITSFSDDE